ncbi:MAG: helix-hairpin-helix domain-containing protein [Azoarcus sp.]|jgi:competence protein ComEA|nr:helix-hairpin-helix domain-containing protein [Azoarcus sp.]
MRRFLRSLILAVALSPLAAMAIEPVNINTADAAALQQVKGIGPAKANAIVEYRKTNGPFASVNDLTKVSGIGEKSLAKMKPEITVGNAGNAGNAAAKSPKATR